jgi:hypothetical protein
LKYLEWFSLNQNCLICDSNLFVAIHQEKITVGSIFWRKVCIVKLATTPTITPVCPESPNSKRLLMTTSGVLKPNLHQFFIHKISPNQYHKRLVSSSNQFNLIGFQSNFHPPNS